MARATILVHGDLADLLPAGRREGEFHCTFDGRPAVKDVLEAAGIPHPEIAAIVVNGEPAGFDRHLADGDRVEAWPAGEAAVRGLVPALAAMPEDAEPPRFVPPPPGLRRGLLEGHAPRPG